MDVLGYICELIAWIYIFEVGYKSVKSSVLSIKRLLIDNGFKCLNHFYLMRAYFEKVI